MENSDVNLVERFKHFSDAVGLFKRKMEEFSQQTESTPPSPNIPIMSGPTITIRGKLGNEQARASDVREAAAKMFHSMRCSIEYPCIVAISYREEIAHPDDYIETGEHLFRIQHDDDLTWLERHTTAAIALQLSLNAQIKQYLSGFPPLALLCNFAKKAPEAKVATPKPEQEKEHEKEVAKAEDEFAGEWQIEQPRYELKNWVVSDKVKEQFTDAVNIMRYRDKIYEEWGFGEVDPNPRAIVCFYGPPGTGKTMAAHVIAKELGKPILCADYAQVESKYLGESPKRLASAFKAAAKNDAVLFFDEADSFLGKRIENVQQSSDQATNSLRSSMLILLENFKGVVIFATNLVSNFDKAFESRVLAFIEVELPNRQARRAIIKSMLPEKMPLAADFGPKALDALADASEGFSGRHIRSAMQLGLVKAATRSDHFGKDEVRCDELMAAFTQIKETMEDLNRKRSGASSNEDRSDNEIELSEAEKVSLTELAKNKIK